MSWRLQALDSSGSRSLDSPKATGAAPFSATRFKMYGRSRPKQSRIVMPMSLQEYEKAFTYAIIIMEQQNTTSQEGVETLESTPFEDEVLGKGQFTSKLYQVNTKVPPLLRAFTLSKPLTISEESWTAYPKSRTVAKCSLFSQCTLTIDTVNIADNGCSENAHGLSDELLALRKVETIDIASVSRDCWSKLIGTAKLDLSSFKSKKTDRGPLFKGWQDMCHPVMTTYKLVTMDAPIWGIGSRLEDAMIAVERALFLECHKICFAWIDEWYGMTLEQIIQMEKENDVLLKKRLQFTATKPDIKRKNMNDKKQNSEQLVVS